jgi:hypothetical protein
MLYKLSYRRPSTYTVSGGWIYEHYTVTIILGRGTFPLELEPSWSWSYGSWIYNYLCNQCLSPLELWVWTAFIARCTRYNICDKVCQWLATGRWFSPGTLFSSTNKIDRHNITEILLKVVLNTINLNLKLKSIRIIWLTNTNISRSDVSIITHTDVRSISILTLRVVLTDSNIKTFINICLTVTALPACLTITHSICLVAVHSIVSYTGTILFTIWSPIAFHTCYKIVHKSSQICPQLPSINAKKNSSYKFKMLFPIAFHTC